MQFRIFQTCWMEGAVSMAVSLLPENILTQILICQKDLPTRRLHWFTITSALSDALSDTVTLANDHPNALLDIKQSSAIKSTNAYNTKASQSIDIHRQENYVGENILSARIFCRQENYSICKIQGLVIMFMFTGGTAILV